MVGTVDIVIGAGYGDEGKGATVNYLAHQRFKVGQPIVVRSHSGHQAGHTVVSGKIRHVFSHVGSGVFENVPTYFGPEFVAFPPTFLKEVSEIQTKAPKANTKCIFHPNCRVTTPIDIELNRLAEQSRGGKKHGSCGMGFGETIERSQYYPFTLDDCLNRDTIYARLKVITENWVPRRAAELGIPEADRFSWAWTDTSWWELFADECLEMLSAVYLSDERVLLRYDHLIFEGAQGLGLDQDNGAFPHVTRSNTGLKAPLAIIEKIMYTGCINVVYATRAYVTRHGAGPLNHEVAKLPFNVVDLTNVPNQFQGTLRYAHLDLNDLVDRIRDDLKSADCENRLIPKLNMTCVDQVAPSLDHPMNFWVNGQFVEASPFTALSYLRLHLQLDEVFVTAGNGRQFTHPIIF